MPRGFAETLGGHLRRHPPFQARRARHPHPPDLALHISPTNSSCEESSPSRYVTEHVHGFDLWKQPQKFSNVASPAFENVGVSTVLCLANPPPGEFGGRVSR
jgi:hypothetical protein